ncbi:MULTISPECIES: glycosyltransferase family 2 protein [Brachybacterium]|uniref:glycosyltransferase family 2 protein n=1 Tax=Brachybacterium TaxID=43668 RepID=UPI003FD4D77D
MNQNQKTADSPLVSLVIPVYNSMPYLIETLDAIEQQGLDENQLEVILVNDGSTDGSEKVLADYAEKHPNYRLLNQPNSGGPADPCNKGIAAVTGKYFFVVGSDDVLTENALGDLAAYAEEHDSDIVLAKMAGINGRHAPGSMFKATKPDAHLVDDSLFNSLTAIKLFRTDLQRKTGAYNPTHLRVGSDQPFTAACYLAADKISVCADRPYVMIRTRDDGKNVTSDSRTSLEYIELLDSLLGVMLKWSEPGELRDGVLYRPVHGALRKSLLPRFLNLSAEEQEKVVAEIQRLVTPLFNETVAGHLASLDRLKVRLALAGSMDVLRDVIKWEKQNGRERLTHDGHGFHLDLPAPLAKRVGVELLRDIRAMGVANLEDLVVEGGVVRLEASAYVRNSDTAPDSALVRLRRRDSDEKIDLAVIDPRAVKRAGARALSFKAEVDTTAMDHGVWDLYVVHRYGDEELQNRLGRYRSERVTDERRVLLDSDLRQNELGVAYFTKGHGNLSLDVGYTLLARTEPKIASVTVLRESPDRELALLRMETVERVLVTAFPGRLDKPGYPVVHLENGMLAVSLPAWTNRKDRRICVANAHGSVVLRLPAPSGFSNGAAKPLRPLATSYESVFEGPGGIRGFARRLGVRKPSFMRR